jgi:hypothetical protein
MFCAMVETIKNGWTATVRRHSGAVTAAQAPIGHVEPGPTDEIKEDR